MSSEKLEISFGGDFFFEVGSLLDKSRQADLLRALAEMVEKDKAVIMKYESLLEGDGWDIKIEMQIGKRHVRLPENFIAKFKERAASNNVFNSEKIVGNFNASNSIKLSGIDGD